MCRRAVADGVKTLIATPRWQAGRSEPPLPFDDCRRKAERLEEAARGALTVKLGFALQFSTDLPDLVARHGSKLALAGKSHLLVSLPSVGVPPEAEEVWASLADAGFSVVLAHPECNTVLRRDSARLARWVARGLMLQVDASSVAGAYGREVRGYAIECLRKYEGQAVVASNARWGTDQKQKFGQAYQELVSRVGARKARKFTSDTPASLIGEAEAHSRNRRPPFFGLTTMFRSLGPIKSLTGES